VYIRQINISNAASLILEKRGDRPRSTGIAPASRIRPRGALSPPTGARGDARSVPPAPTGAASRGRRAPRASTGARGSILSTQTAAPASRGSIQSTPPAATASRGSIMWIFIHPCPSRIGPMAVCWCSKTEPARARRINPLDNAGWRVCFGSDSLSACYFSERRHLGSAR